MSEEQLNAEGMWNVRDANPRIVGRVELETMSGVPGELGLKAYAFNSDGRLLGEDTVSREGRFEIATDLKEGADVEVVISPASDVKHLRGEASYSQHYSAQDWMLEERALRLRSDLSLQKVIWWPWWPQRICVSGHVRKIDDGDTCPVSFVKVEIFDVDREACWWDYILPNVPKLIDRRVIRIPELLELPATRRATLRSAEPAAQISCQPADNRSCTPWRWRGSKSPAITASGAVGCGHDAWLTVCLADLAGRLRPATLAVC